MRFVWAVVSFVLAAGLIGAGIAQRTVWLGPSEETVTVSAEQESPFTVIDSDVFESLPEALPGEQGTLSVAGEAEVFATYARSIDVTAWLSDQRYTRVSAGEDGIETTTVEPTVELEGEPEGRSPVGSDLWLEEFTGEGSLEKRFSFPEGMELSVLVASDGTAPAPGRIEVTWPVDNSTPAAYWFIGGGIVLLAVGIVLYLLGLRHSRRSRGPRRKGLPVAAEPVEAAGGTEIDRAEEKGVITGSPETKAIGGDRSVFATLGRRARLAVPVVALSALVLAGCTAETDAPGPSPSPSETAETENLQQPALTEAQAERVVADLAETVAEADENNDATLAGERLSDTALAMREVNYSLREDVDEYKALPAIPSGPIRILLPQAYDGWPRTTLVVVEDEGDGTVAPTILSLTQEDPWSKYRASLVASLEPSAEIPELAPSYQGAVVLPPDSSFLALAPDQVAGGYADVLGSGEDSDVAELFDTEGDSFLSAVADKRQATRKEFDKTAEGTGELKFGERAGKADPFSLATLHSGAIVGTVVVEEETVRPTDDDAVIRFENDPVLQALTGEDQSAGGVRTSYVDQLFFYVPAQGSDERIRLLGWSSSIRDATLLER